MVRCNALSGAMAGGGELRLARVDTAPVAGAYAPLDVVEAVLYEQREPQQPGLYGELWLVDAPGYDRLKPKHKRGLQPTRHTCLRKDIVLVDVMPRHGGRYPLPAMAGVEMTQLENA